MSPNHYNTGTTENLHEQIVHKLCTDEEVLNLGNAKREKNGIFEKIFLKLSKTIVKKCFKDRSGAFMYKTFDVLMKLGPGEESGVLDGIKSGYFISNSSALRQAYKCCDTILQNAPDLAAQTAEAISLRALQKENDIDNVKQIFALSEKISVLNPELAKESQNIKKIALQNLCLNHPEQGIELISSMVTDTYPGKEDLSHIYNGISTILKSSQLPKKTYTTLMKILQECSLSGYNSGENAKSLNDICNIISARTVLFHPQIREIKSNLLKCKINNQKPQNEVKNNQPPKSKKNELNMSLVKTAQNQQIK